MDVVREDSVGNAASAGESNYNEGEVDFSGEEGLAYDAKGSRK